MAISISRDLRTVFCEKKTQHMLHFSTLQHNSAERANQLETQSEIFLIRAKNKDLLQDTELASLQFAVVG